MAGSIYDEALEDSETPKAKPSIYDDLLADTSRAQGSHIKASIQQGSKVSPDQAAEARTLSMRFGVPASLVERNLDEWKRRAVADVPIDEMQVHTPTLPNWLMKPENASVAHDDLENLGLLEYIVSAPGRAFAQSTAQHDFAELRFQSMFRPLTQPESDQLNASKYQSTAGGNLGANTWFRKAVKGTGSFLANQVPVVEYAAAGALTTGAVGATVGSVVPGVGTLAGGVSGLGYGARAGALYGVLKTSFITEAGLAYDEFQGDNFKDEFGQPLAPEVAKMAALAVGAINAPIEAGAQELLLRSIPGLKKLGAGTTRAAVKAALRQPSVRAGLLAVAKSYGVTLTGETAQEVAQQAVTILAGELSKVVSGQSIPIRTPTEVAQDLSRTAVEAATSFAIPVGAGPIMQTARISRQVQEAQKGVELFTELGNAVADSKLLKRQPDAVQSFIAQATKGGPVETVFLPIDTFRTYWQEKGIDPALIAEQVTGSPAAFEQAAQTGVDLAIPTARYAATLAGTEHNAFFVNEVRLAPDAMNGREVEVFSQEQKRISETEKVEGIRQQSPIAAQVMQSLEGAGVESKTAGKYAQLADKVFGGGGLVDRAGMDPAQQFEKYGVKVERPDLQAAAPEGATTFEQPGAPALVDRGEEIPGLADLAAGLEGASLTEAPTGSTELNASGESDASIEALSRITAMKAKGQQFVKYDRAGNRMPVIGPQAVDYKPQAGEVFGFEGPEGFTLLENRGGKIPASMPSVTVTNPMQLPEAGEQVDGRTVLDDVPNMTSIEASLNEYTVLPGTRDVPMILFDDGVRPVKSYSVSETQRIAKLAVQIRENNVIAPLIVVFDANGPYVLEGSHRLDALKTLDAKSFPAVVVIDEENEPIIADPALIPRQTFFQPFFHGTPHNFDQFSTEHIGSGEGAQAYGWGLYFAEDPAIAAHYFDTLSGDPQIVKMKLGSMVIGPHNDFNYSARAHVNDLENFRATTAEMMLSHPLDLFAAGSGGFQKHVLAYVDEQIENFKTEWPEGVAAAQQLRKELSKPGAASISFDAKSGGVYQVEIPDKVIKTFLDWDAPLAKQTDNVKSVVRELLIKEGYLDAKNSGPRKVTAAWRAWRIARGGFVTGSDTGASVYDLVMKNGLTADAKDYAKQEAASKDLEAAGVFGIRYLDANSRDGKTGKRNVVVFNDKHVNLTHKDGTAVTPAERKAYFQKRGDDSPRGAITFGADRQFTIQLFQNANLSTFLHESGHFYLEVFGDIADELSAKDPSTLTESQKGVLADWQSILTFLQVENRSQIQRQQHELFARGFEAYLFEGKAPSIELREAFASFRAWLLGIYQSLKALDVELTDEVRGVFDRMLASEEAIAAAESEARVQEMFTDARSAGMSDKEFALYRSTVADASRMAREQLAAKLTAEVRREQKAEWKAERVKVEADVVAQFNETPVYQAIAFVRSGLKPDGTAIEGVEPGENKLSKTLLVERFGKGRLARLPKPYVYAAEGGLDPDVVAQQFGFSSGDEMLSAFEAAPVYAAAVKLETDQRMLALNGSMLLDGTVFDEAQSAVANDAREEIIRKELSALSKLKAKVAPFTTQVQSTAAEEAAYERRWLEAEAKLRIAIAEGRKQVEIDTLRDQVRALRAKSRSGGAVIRGALPPATVVRELAEQRIAGMTLEQITPGQWMAAARRASQKATELAGRQDFDAAIKAKRDELLNLALYRRAATVKAELEARVKRAAKLSSNDARARLGTAGDSYLDQVDGILDRYEMARVSASVLERRASVARWIAAIEGEGLPVDLPAEVVEDSRRINYRQVTTAELEGVLDGIDQIVHLARLKNRLLKSADQRELAAVAARLSQSIRENERKTPKVVERDRRASAEKSRVVADFFAGHRKLASVLRELDGFEDGGAAWSAIMVPLNEAASREATMTADATKAFAELIETAYPGRQKKQLYQKQFIASIGRSMSRMERLMVALNWGNDGNRERVRTGEKWSNEQAQAVLDTLTPIDAAFVQGTFDFVNSYWTEIAEKQKRVTGLTPAKVESATFTIRGVEMQGGYFPIKYDDRLSAKAMAGLDLEAAQLAKQAAYAQSTTKRGHTEARVATTSMPVRLDFGVMFEHVAQVIHDLSHHEALIDVGRILGHSDVQAAILEVQGDIVYRQIRNTVRDVAFGAVPATNGFEKSINYVRMGATVVGLGWNVTTAMLQPIGLANSVHRIGVKYVGRGIYRLLRNPASINETVAWVYDNSEMMKNRGRTMQREIAEVRNSLGVNTGRISGWVDEALKTTSFNYVSRQGIADSYFFMIQAMQTLVDLPTFLGAYEKAMDQGESEQRAFRMADQAVLDSQGGGQVKDLAQVQRGGPMMKLWTNFYSFFNVLHNQAVESHRRTHYRNPAEVGRLASDYMVLFIAPAVLSYMLREALRPGDADDDDALAWRIPMEIVSYISGTMLGLREVSGALQGAYGYEGPAGARAFASLSRLGQQVKQGEIDEALLKALNDVGGVILHYPAGQVRRTLDGIRALDEGKTANPLAVLTGAPRQ